MVFRKSKKGLRIEHKEKQENKNNEASLAVELFNKRFPQKKGMLKEIQLQEKQARDEKEKRERERQ